MFVATSSQLWGSPIGNIRGLCNFIRRFRRRDKNTRHPGVYALLFQISEQGYTLLYLTNRAIGQSAMTREYVFSLEEAGVVMPRGPLFLQIDSLVGALQTEVRKSGIKPLLF